VSEPLNSVQIALADGIAERVVAAIQEDRAASPVRMLQAKLARTIANAVVENPSLKTTIDQANLIGHNGGPDIENEMSGAMTISHFCTKYGISRSTLYEMWRSGTGPKYFKAGTAVRITDRAGTEWEFEREAAAALENA